MKCESFSRRKYQSKPPKLMQIYKNCKKIILVYKLKRIKESFWFKKVLTDTNYTWFSLEDFELT